MGEEERLPKGWKIHLDRKKKDAWDTYRKFRPTAAGAENTGPEKGTGADEKIATPEHEAMPGAAEKIVVEERVVDVEKKVVVEKKAEEPKPELVDGIFRKDLELARDILDKKLAVPEPVVEKKAEKGKARVLSSSWSREKKRDKRVDVK